MATMLPPGATPRGRGAERKAIASPRAQTTPDTATQSSAPSSSTTQRPDVDISISPIAPPSHAGRKIRHTDLLPATSSPTDASTIPAPITDRDASTLPLSSRLNNTLEREQAWAELVPDLIPGLMRHALRITNGDFHAAEDVVQIALMNLFTRITHGQQIDNMPAYANKVVHNAGVDYLEGQQKERHLSLDAPTGVTDKPLEEQLPLTPSAEEEIINARTVTDLVRLLQEKKINKDHLAVLLLHAAGSSPKEIAEERAIPEGTARRQLGLSRANAGPIVQEQVDPSDIRNRRLKWSRA